MRWTMSRLAWAWYGVWTVVDYYTTLWFYGVHHEVNIIINAMAAFMPIDVALAVHGIIVTILLAAMYYSQIRVLRIATEIALWLRAIAPVNNIILLQTGYALVDYVMMWTGASPQAAVVLMAVAPTIIYIVIAKLRGRL